RISSPTLTTSGFTISIRMTAQATRTRVKVSLQPNGLTPMSRKMQTVDASWVSRLLPKRPAQAHKGYFGHVLVVGGDYGYGGAAIMAAQSAARSGAGLVSLYTRQEHISAMLSRQPEVMANHQHFTAMLDRATVILAGPGLGADNWGKALLAQLLGNEQPQLLDADALNY